MGGLGGATHYPRTDCPSTRCPHGGLGGATHYPRTDCPGGTLGPRTRCPRGTVYISWDEMSGGTAFPRTKYPADNLQGGTKFPATTAKPFVRGYNSEKALHLNIYQRSTYYLGVASTSVLRRWVLLPQRLVSHSAICNRFVWKLFRAAHAHSHSHVGPASRCRMRTRKGRRKRAEIQRFSSAPKVFKVHSCIALSG